MVSSVSLKKTIATFLSVFFLLALANFVQAKETLNGEATILTKEMDKGEIPPNETHPVTKSCVLTVPDDLTLDPGESFIEEVSVSGLATAKYVVRLAEENNNLFSLTTGYTQGFADIIYGPNASMFLSGFLPDTISPGATITVTIEVFNFAEQLVCTGSVTITVGGTPPPPPTPPPTPEIVCERFPYNGKISVRCYIPESVSDWDISGFGTNVVHESGNMVVFTLEPWADCSNVTITATVHSGYTYKFPLC